MRYPVLRLVPLAALLVAAGGCASFGSGTSLPFASTSNGGGGSTGTHSPGGTTTALLRFVQGSPDFGSVDVCVDNETFAPATPSTAYGSASPLFSTPGGITETIAVYPSTGEFGGGPGVECPTAPGPYLGTSPIAVTTIAPGKTGNPRRETIVLGGTAASGTLGFYIFGEPSFATAVTGSEAISHNGAPAFSATTPNQSIGFGEVPPSGPQVDLAGAQSVPAPTKAATSSAAINPAVVSPIATPPTSFYDGIGMPSGGVVPVGTASAPAAVAGPYVVQLYAIDAPGGSLGLVAVAEQTTGFGF